jgi:uncharacterized protein YuzE
MADRAKAARLTKLTARYDPDADAAYVRLSNGKYDVTEELDDRRNIDYDAEGCALGVEFLYVSDGIDLSDLPRAAEIDAALRRAGLRVLA